MGFGPKKGASKSFMRALEKSRQRVPPMGNAIHDELREDEVKSATAIAIEKIREDERQRIAKWLRSFNGAMWTDYLANMIERGKHATDGVCATPEKGGGRT